MLSLLLLGACTRTPEPPALRNLIIVTLDTVRADHLSAYGYAAPTSPHLEALGQRADRYVHAISSSPWTLPSHASLLTGLPPSAHGAVTASPEHGADAWPLPESALTVAEVLAEAGYQTAAFVANRGYLSPEFGLDQGFETYEVISGDAALNARVTTWLEEEADPARPMLLFVNYMSAHRPYNLAPLPDWPTPEDRDALTPLTSLLMQQARGEPLDAATVATVIRQYDHGVANADAALGDLLAVLDRMSRLQSSALVVTADHGEAFGEHEIIEHGKDVYEPLVRVPLLIQSPGQQVGRIREEAVSSAHLPGLLAEHFPPLAALPSPDAVLSENRYCRPKDQGVLGGRYLRIRQAIYDWPLKLIVSSDGSDELYDVAADPAEAAPLPVAQAGHLRAKVPTPTPRDAAPAPSGGQTEEALRALGYIE